jgi:hypothetical protein
LILHTPYGPEIREVKASFLVLRLGEIEFRAGYDVMKVPFWAVLPAHPGLEPILYAALEWFYGASEQLHRSGTFAFAS